MYGRMNGLLPSNLYKKEKKTKTKKGKKKKNGIIL
jgi:hypothetical protein